MCGDCRQPGFQKRFIANFMAKADRFNYKLYREKKEHLFAQVQGSVLEIGPGTGPNLQFFKNEIKWTGLEPNPVMHQFLRQEAARFNRDIDILTGKSESLPVPDESMDFVISTLVLCSVSDLGKTLEEILRVLKPGGRFLFIEHVADHPWTMRWIVQKLTQYTPYRYFSDGCDPGRKIGGAIEKAGFSTVKYQRYMQEGPGPVLAICRPHIWGEAVKALGFK